VGWSGQVTKLINFGGSDRVLRENNLVGCLGLGWVGTFAMWVFVGSDPINLEPCPSLGRLSVAQSESGRQDPAD